MEGMNEADAAKSPDEGAHRERVERLVAALRSGQFRQGVNYLHQVQPRTLCCLGVACEVAIAGGLQVPMVEESGSVFYGDRTNGSRSVLPVAVRIWFGFLSHNPKLRIPEEIARRHSGKTDDQGVPLGRLWREDLLFRATDLNDHFRFSFDEIADCFQRTFLNDGQEQNVENVG